MNKNNAECVSCEKFFPEENLRRCREYEYCESAFCPLCAPHALDIHEYCEACRMLYCVECGVEIARGYQISCVVCDEIFCDACANIMLDEKKLCATHSLHKHVVCAYCETSVFVNQSISCNSCAKHYCAQCAKTRIGTCDECRRKYCVLYSCPNTHKKCHDEEELKDSFLTRFKKSFSLFLKR